MGLFDKFKKRPDEDITDETDGIKSFKYLDQLIRRGSNEITLDFDIELKDERFNNEEKAYRDGIRLNSDNLVIDGCGHTIDAKGKARIFSCRAKNVTVKNITFKNGYAMDSKVHGEGGAIEVRDGSMNIINSKFYDNRCDGRGGAVACFYSELDIKDCTFSKNSSPNDDGGAVCIYGGVLKMSDSQFLENSARNVGAVDISNANFTIEKCTFKGNTAESVGALDNSGPNPLAPTPMIYDTFCEIKNSVFENNSAEKHGAITATKMLNIEGSRIISNTCSKEYVLHFQDNVKLAKCEIAENESPWGIVKNEDSLEIYDCIFRQNRTKSDVLNNPYYTLSVFNTEFIENDAGESVVNNGGDSCTLENCTFEGNIKNDEAKNICNTGNMTLKNPKIAEEGKTIYNESGGHIIIKNYPPNLADKINEYGEIIFEDEIIPKAKRFDFGYLNRLIRKGNGNEITLEEDIIFEDYEKEYFEGGIELDIDRIVIDGAGKTIDGDGKSRIFTVTGKDITLKNITFKNGKSHRNHNNRMNNHGGALRVTKGAELTVQNCKFLNNKSQEFGGAICNSGKLNLYKSKVSDNRSESHGGAVYNYCGNLDLSKSVLSGNDASQKGGAIYNVRGSVNMLGSVVSDNTVTGSGGGGIGSFGLGGAAYNKEGKMDISKSVLSGNYTVSGGGALYNFEGFIRMTKSTISKNVADSSNFAAVVFSSEKGIQRIFNFVTQKIGPRSVSETEYFNADEMGSHIIKGMELKGCIFKENQPCDLGIESISHKYLKEYSSQLGYSVYDKAMSERDGQ